MNKFMVLIIVTLSLFLFIGFTGYSSPQEVEKITDVVEVVQKLEGYKKRWERLDRQEKRNLSDNAWTGVSPAKLREIYGEQTEQKLVIEEKSLEISERISPADLPTFIFNWLKVVREKQK